MRMFLVKVLFYLPTLKVKNLLKLLVGFSFPPSSMVLQSVEIRIKIPVLQTIIKSQCLVFPFLSCHPLKRLRFVLGSGGA